MATFWERLAQVHRRGNEGKEDGIPTHDLTPVPLLEDVLRVKGITSPAMKSSMLSGHSA